jgi:hypothetical protein
MVKLTALLMALEPGAVLNCLEEDDAILYPWEFSVIG